MEAWSEGASRLTVVCRPRVVCAHGNSANRGKRLGGAELFQRCVERTNPLLGIEKAAPVVPAYALPASKSARASSRGLVNRACAFGRRFTARGSTRSGRWPT